MALKLIDSTRNTAMIETKGQLSERGWALWEAPLPGWITLSPSGEGARLKKGRYRMEVFSGRIRAYVDSSFKGEGKPGELHVLDGAVALYNTRGEENALVLITRLA